MPTHSETRVLPYTAQQMYDLVADVGSYPKFLPWTAAARIRSRTDNGQGGVVMEADLVISFKVFRERFGSHVTLWPEAMKIDTRYLDGPFKHMVSNWAFRDRPEGRVRGRVLCGFRVQEPHPARGHWRRVRRGDAAGRQGV